MEPFTFPETRVGRTVRPPRVAQLSETNGASPPRNAVVGAADKNLAVSPHFSKTPSVRRDAAACARAARLRRRPGGGGGRPLPQPVDRADLAPQRGLPQVPAAAAAAGAAAVRRAARLVAAAEGGEGRGGAGAPLRGRALAGGAQERVRAQVRGRGHREEAGAHRGALLDRGAHGRRRRAWTPR